MDENFDFDNFTDLHHMKNLDDFDLYARNHGTKLKNMQVMV